MKVTFLGGAGTVTGSKYLLESPENRILIDCGLFQGEKNLRLKNWQDLSIEAKTIDAIVLTHAHIDHSGYIPRFVKAGFRGKIYCTQATRELCEILLMDSANLQEEDAKEANKGGYSKHHPALPLYSVHDVQMTLSRFAIVAFGDEFNIGDFSLRFYRAGHILGAAQVRIESRGKSILFSGDLGRRNDAILYDPEVPLSSDIIVMESTYGATLHDDRDPLSILGPLVKDVISKRSIMMIPAFAVGRTQALIHSLHKLFSLHPELKIPIYVNSPMAIDVTALYVKYREEHRLSEGDCVDIFGLPKYLEFARQSKKINEKEGPMIVIAGSGMISGGRILHHLESWGNDADNIILLTGYQAIGTRGRALRDGERSLKIKGKWVDINARVEQINVFSAHGDQEELMNWLSSIESRPKKVVLVHGEAESLSALQITIKERLGLPVEIAEEGSSIEF